MTFNEVVCSLSLSLSLAMGYLDLDGCGLTLTIATLQMGDDQIWIQSGLDWPQMGQIRGFFRSDFPPRQMH